MRRNHVRCLARQCLRTPSAPHCVQENSCCLSGASPALMCNILGQHAHTDSPQTSNTFTLISTQISPSTASLTTELRFQTARYCQVISSLVSGRWRLLSGAPLQVMLRPTLYAEEEAEKEEEFIAGGNWSYILPRVQAAPLCAREHFPR